MATIDRIDWHWDSAVEATFGILSDEEFEEREAEIEERENELFEKAGAHIGYFLEWAYKNGFAPDNPETHAVEEYQEVANSEITGIRFLIENCDTKFWDSDLNEQGQKFATFAYSQYWRDLEMIYGGPAYIKAYNQQDLERVSQYLDKLYSEYLLNPPSEQNPNKKQSFLTKLKKLF